MSLAPFGGALYHQRGELDRALALFKKAVSIAPQADAFNNMGVIYATRNQHRKALDAFGEAVKLNPDHPDYKKNMDLARQLVERKGKVIP